MFITDLPNSELYFTLFFWEESPRYIFRNEGENSSIFPWAIPGDNKIMPFLKES